MRLGALTPPQSAVGTSGSWARVEPSCLQGSAPCVAAAPSPAPCLPACCGSLRSAQPSPAPSLRCCYELLCSGQVVVPRISASGRLAAACVFERIHPGEALQDKGQPLHGWAASAAARPPGPLKAQAGWSAPARPLSLAPYRCGVPTPARAFSRLGPAPEACLGPHYVGWGRMTGDARQAVLSGL